MVATVRSGRRTRSPRSRSTAKACGEVTSCTRCRSTYSTAGVSAVSGATRWASQIFSNSVRGSDCATDPLRLGRRLALEAAGGDPVHHLEVCLRAGQHDVGAQPAAAGRAPLVLDDHHYLALRVLARGHAGDVEVAQVRLDAGDPLDALEHRVDGPVSGGRLVELAAVPGQERHGGGRRRPGAAHRVQARELPAAGRAVLEEADQQRVEVAVVDLLLLVRELLQLLEYPVDLLGLELVAQIAEPRGERMAAAVLAQDQVGALEAHVLRA